MWFSSRKSRLQVDMFFLSFKLFSKHFELSLPTNIYPPCLTLSNKQQKKFIYEILHEIFHMCNFSFTKWQNKTESKKKISRAYEKTQLKWRGKKFNFCKIQKIDVKFLFVVVTERREMAQKSWKVYFLPKRRRYFVLPEIFITSNNKLSITLRRRRGCRVWKENQLTEEKLFQKNEKPFNLWLKRAENFLYLLEKPTPRRLSSRNQICRGV